MAMSDAGKRPGASRLRESGRRPAYLPATAAVLLFGALILSAVGSAESATLLAEPVEAGLWPGIDPTMDPAIGKDATTPGPRLSGGGVTSLAALGLLGAMLLREGRARHGRKGRWHPAWPKRPAAAGGERGPHGSKI